MRAILATAASALLIALPVTAQTPGPAPDMETLAIRSLNICLSVEAGGDLHQLATAQGYEADNNAYSRRIGDRWAFFFAYNVLDDGGKKKGFACRLMVMSPKPNTSDAENYRQRGPVLADGPRVMERLSNGPLSFGNPFTVQYIEQPHPTRRPNQRTLLYRFGGDVGELIYLEDGFFNFEMLYAKGPRADIADPGLIDEATDPKLNGDLQQEVTMLARNTWCAQKAGGCGPVTPVRRRPNSPPTASSDGVYLRGSGNGARPLSSLEQDYYAGKGYVVTRRSPSGF